MGARLGVEREEDPETSSGQAETATGPARRGLGRGLGAILPARTAVPLELVGLGARRRASFHPDEDGVAQAPSEDRPRPGPTTIGLHASSRLCSRAELVAGLEQALATARRTPGTVALVVLGVDGFRHVNTAFGHEAGDAMLRALGDRLVRGRREDDLVGRLGGDEFAVVCGRVESALGARRAVQRLIADFDAPVVAGGAEHRLRATFGLVLDAPGGDPVPAQVMLSRAQLAKQRAKEAGNRLAVFTPERDGHHLPRWKTSSKPLRGLEADDDGGSSPPGWPTRTAPK